MSHSELFHSEKKELPSPSRNQPKGRYQPPRLEELGDIGDVTLGGSPGAGDTINIDTTNPMGMDP